eukprot:6485642-Amphidinium_carterae.1
MEAHQMDAALYHWALKRCSSKAHHLDAALSRMPRMPPSGSALSKLFAVTKLEGSLKAIYENEEYAHSPHHLDASLCMAELSRIWGSFQPVCASANGLMPLLGRAPSKPSELQNS